MPYKSSAQVLMLLLKKVPDAKKIEHLLQPESLLFLLQQYGGQKDEIQQRLAGGAFPEELLLELLNQQPDADRLLSQLKENHLLKVEEPIIESFQGVQHPPLDRKKLLTPHEEEEPKRIFKFITPPSPLELLFAGVITVICTSAIPLLFGFASFETTLILAPLGGIVGGLSVVPRSAPRWARLFLGLVWSFSTLAATVIYLNYLGRRDWMMTLEFFIPAVMGAAPALALYYFFFFKEE